METLILHSLSAYFFFFFINYSKLGERIRRWIDFHVSLGRTGYYSEGVGKVLETISYPIRQCAFCFSFWAFLFLWVVNGEVMFLAGPVVVLFIDLLFKELAGLKK